MSPRHVKALVGGMDLGLPMGRKALNSDYFLDLTKVSELNYIP